MANITAQNNIRYAIDSLRSESFGVLYTASNAVNLTRAQQVKGITVNGSQPASTTRHIAFLIGGSWGKLTTSGTFSKFANNNCTYDNVHANGNTPAELTALTNVPALAGIQFGVAIALMSPDTVTYGSPTCGLTFKCYNLVATLTATEESPEYDLGSNGQIITLAADTKATNGGTVSVQARVTDPNGHVSAWGALDSFSGQKAVKVQFRGYYTCATLNVSSAKIENVSALYSTGESLITGSYASELYTITQDWYMPVKSCRLTLKHSQTDEENIKAYLVLRKAPIQVKGESLGIGTGAKKVFSLQHTDGLKYDAIKLYYNNVQVFTDYEYNCQTGRVTCEAGEGVLVTCDYEYGWDVEDWQEMTLSSKLSFDGYDQSEFRYTKPPEDTTDRSVCAIKLVMDTTGGRITSEVIGTGSGFSQSFRLKKKIREGNITLTADGSLLAAKYWSLQDDPQYVTVNAGYGMVIRATYDWVSDTPVVYEMYAVYAD